MQPTIPSSGFIILLLWSSYVLGNVMRQKREVTEIIQDVINEPSQTNCTAEDLLALFTRDFAKCYQAIRKGIDNQLKPLVDAGDYENACSFFSSNYEPDSPNNCAENIRRKLPENCSEDQFVRDALKLIDDLYLTYYDIIKYECPRYSCNAYGNTYTLVQMTNCARFEQSISGITYGVQPCPSRTVFDVSGCNCNYAFSVNCPI